MRSAAIFAAFIFALSAQAQLLTAQGVGITVNNSAQLTVQGDVLATSGATIANNGTVDLTGDFTNNSGNDLFGSSQGTVLLNGGSQSVGGSSVTLFNNLSLLGGPITLTQDINTGGYPGMTGVLSLASSQLFLNTKKLYVLNPAPGAITRTTGYLVSETDPLAGYGEVQWFIGASAPGSYVIPFGNDVTNDYLPLIFSITAPGSGGSGSITCSTYPTDPFAAPNNRPLPMGLTALTDMGGTENAQNVVDRFWPMRTDDYSIPPTATITFTYRDGEWNTGTNTIIESTLQAQRWDGIWSNPPMGGVNTVANTVATPPVNLFAQVWALTQGFTPLPVELLAFTGERMTERDVLLTWSTASEHNNEGFEVWRMIEGQDAFVPVGWVDGAGESQSTLVYTLVDINPTDRISYYRLKQVDHDGVFTWSDVVAVKGTEARQAVVLFPNPATGSFTIEGVGSEVVGVDLLDAAGRSVKHWRTAGVCGIADVPPGAYAVSIEQADGDRIVERLIVR